MGVFTEVTNSFINVREQIKDKNGNWKSKGETETIQKFSAFLRRDISGNGTTVISTFGNPTEIIDFEMSMVEEDPICYPLLYIRPNKDSQYNDNLFHIIGKTGRGSATPNYIELHGSTFLKSETSGGNSKISLKKPIFLPNGCELVIKGFNGEDTRSTYKILWNEVIVHD